MSVRETGARLRLELVAGEVLRLERDRLGEVALEVGRALARNAVDEVERDVVEAGLPQCRHRGAHVLGARTPLERLEQVRLEALGAERDTVDAVLAEQRGQAGRDGLGVGLDGRLRGSWQAGEETRQRGGLGDGGSAPAEEDRVDVPEQIALELELGEERVHIRAVLARVADDRDEVAVAAPVRAERQVHVEVAGAGHLRSLSRLRTARNASCGTSTPPTCFIRFLPFFCFSSSFRLREMSPP